MKWISLDYSLLEILLLLLCNEVLCTALFQCTKSHAITWHCSDHSPSSYWCIYSSTNCSSANWQEFHLLQVGVGELGHGSVYEHLWLHDTENPDSVCCTKRIFHVVNQIGKNYMIIVIWYMFLHCWSKKYFWSLNYDILCIFIFDFIMQNLICTKSFELIHYS